MHSSHFEVLAENGFAGAAVWIGLFAYSIVTLFRIRRRATAMGVPDDEQYFLITSANALLVSIVAFIVGGAFIALSLNDLTWYTFALVAALDRLSLKHEASVVLEPQTSVVAGPFSSTTNISEPHLSPARAIHSRSSFC